MSMDSNTDSIQMSAAIEQFCIFTGADESTARMTLECCNWNVELAINMYVDETNGQTSGQTNANNQTSQTSSATIPPNDVYGSQSEQSVRPPIPPVRQVLVEDFPTASYANHMRRPNSGSVFDAFRDFEQEARWQQQQMTGEANDAEPAAVSSKRRTLEDLFRPPLDLICRGTLEIAKEEGVRQNKWLMVNIQNHQEFSCQVLNRDVWSNPAVKSIIKDNFIFWQTYHDNSEGQRFMQFYKVVDFPYVAILDPRTGEKLRYWTHIDQVSFCDLVTEFLHENPSPAGAGETMPPIRRQSPSKALYEESEEAQLKAAIEASLQEVAKAETPISQNATIDVDDSDLETFADSDTEDKSTLASKEARNNDKSCPTHTDQTNHTTTKETKTVEDYRLYLGPENGSKVELVIRYPDGNRENIIFPSDSQLKALFLYLSSKGYDKNEYDLVSNFPKRNLSEVTLEDGLTLESAGIHSRDVLYVQHKS